MTVRVLTEEAAGLSIIRMGITRNSLRITRCACSVCLATQKIVAGVALTTRPHGHQEIPLMTSSKTTATRGEGEAEYGNTLTITVTPEHAKLVAEILFSDLTSEIEGWHEVVSRRDVDDLRATLDFHSQRLEQVAWGEPTSDVTLTLSEHAMGRLRGQLSNVADDGEMDLQRLRDIRHKVEVAIAVSEQVEATR